jgi:DNA polymerase I
MTDNRLFLIDALALIYRSYNICRSKPFNSTQELEEGTLNGFFGTIETILQTQKPSHLAVVFDIKKPTFRHELYAKYKAHRRAMPAEIAKAVIKIKESLQNSGIATLELEGYEADDIIGTLAKQLANNHFKVYIVSPDKDFMQLVDKNIFIYRQKKTGKEARIIDLREVCNTWMVKDPTQLIDIFTFAGDDSDNIPGIPGMGKRLVKKLLSQYGSIDAMFNNLDKMNEKQRQLFQEHKADILLSRKLVTIDIHVPIVVNSDNLLVKGIKKT